MNGKTLTRTCANGAYRYRVILFGTEGVLVDTSSPNTKPARTFPTSVTLLRRLRSGGVRCGAVSAVPNLRKLLNDAGVAELFDVTVDGSEESLVSAYPGADSRAALYTAAASRLGAAPYDAVVIDTDAAGLKAAGAVGFGLVVGVDRDGNHAELLSSGADIVVDDLSELDLGSVLNDPWMLVYEGFDPLHEARREALCTLGNGYLATRGAAPESSDDGVHYPGTYIAGVYNRLISEVRGKQLEDESIVNLPNWLPLDVRIENGTWWSEGGLVVKEERQELDLRRGLLTRRLRLADESGRTLRIVQRRLVSMAHSHVAALETTLVSEGWDGTVEVRSGLDGGIVNNNVSQYAALAKRHLRAAVSGEAAPNTLVLESETSQSQIRVAVAMRTTSSGKSVPRFIAGGSSSSHLLSLRLRDGKNHLVEKIASYATSRDHAISSVRTGALSHLDRVGNFASLLPAHELAWRHLWDRFAVDVDAEAVTQLELNLHLFHLLQTLSVHTAELDAGVPARGLHGEGYRGHIFWDELFVFPLLSIRIPSLTRSLLAYRWRRLDAARHAARRAGLSGALFPWQSGSDGREETPVQLFNERSGRWVADNSRLQHHVALAVAYNVWHYYQVSGDVEFLQDQGAELIIEVARLFESLATHDAESNRYDIAGVMGPDEYHDTYPGSDTPGLRNNAYTNLLAAWVFCRAIEVVRLLDEHHCTPLWEKLALERTELERWERLSTRLRVPFHRDGVISQFEGYEQLAELDWDRYRAKYGNIGRLDLILEAEGDTTNRYKLSKQADVLMLLYLFHRSELEALLDRLGYRLEPDTIPRTVDYYLARTAHGSTLSRVVHAWVLASIDRARSWSVFSEALRADLDDTSGGRTGHGIHLGAMAGTVDLVLRGYAGMRVREDILWFDPQLPQEVGRIAFELFYRGQHVRVGLSSEALHLQLEKCAAAPIQVDVSGRRVTLAAGESRLFSLRGGS